jgi:hypothetical protein
MIDIVLAALPILLGGSAEQTSRARPAFTPLGFTITASTCCG